MLRFGSSFLALCVATALSAATTSRVYVRILGDGCSATPVYLVKDGNDKGRIKMTAEENWECMWTAQTGPTFSTRLSYFSLRVGTRRTLCHTAHPEQIGAFEWQGVVDARCCDYLRSRLVTVETNPSVPLGYVREVEGAPREPEIMRSTPRPCTEHGFFVHGMGSVEQVQFENEKIYLEIPVTDGEAPLRFHIRSIPEQQREEQRQVLNRDGVLYERIIGRGQGNQQSPPNLSGNAIESDRQRLTAGTIIVTVK